jgi:hypothetical protein
MARAEVTVGTAKILEHPPLTPPVEGGGFPHFEDPAYQRGKGNLVTPHRPEERDFDTFQQALNFGLFDFVLKLMIVYRILL